jgi:hypothetical protein
MDFPIELEWFEIKPTFRPEHPLRDWLPGAMRIPPVNLYRFKEDAQRELFMHE